MTDVIRLLPDSVANQIAAGEVVQRPASVIKELMENSVDAGATRIDVVVKEAGRSFISVSDNGCGMSSTDARMCFERHATSKLRSADDLFRLHTMGFRGEALASVAAVAQVELQTRRKEDELGTRIVIEGSVVKDQTPKAMTQGTLLIIKNLFFNVPARRNFLKSNDAEMRHIVEEFTRVTLMHPDIAFTLTSNEKEIFHLYPGVFKQRICNLFGKDYEKKLLPVSQSTQNVSINGFIVKPEFSRKSRGEQYFFANHRFIKHSYLAHAVENAFQDLLPKDSYPGFFLDIEVDPKDIDVNIHPTKTEVNFIDVKLIYAVLHAAVRKAIGQHNLAPLLDFDADPYMMNSFDEASQMKTPIQAPSISFSSSFNPFHNASPREPMNEDWRIAYENPNEEERNNEIAHLTAVSEQASMYVQLQNSYIVTTMKSGLLVVDQHLAHERILFEKFLKQLENHTVGSQRELFPHNITLSPNDAALLKDIRADLQELGFGIEILKNNTFVVNSTPADLENNDILSVVERILDIYKNGTNLKDQRNFYLARAVANQTAVKSGQHLSDQQMKSMIDQLFACSVPETAPNGKKIFIIINTNEIIERLK